MTNKDKILRSLIYWLTLISKPVSVALFHIAKEMMLTER